MSTNEARDLAATLLQVTAEAEGTEPEPSGTDALIQRALDEAAEARKEIESILAAFAERARRIANQEARDAE